MTDLKKYRKDSLNEVENRDAAEIGGSAKPDPNRKNILPKMRPGVEYTQNRREGK